MDLLTTTQKFCFLSQKKICLGSWTMLHDSFRQWIKTDASVWRKQADSIYNELCFFVNEHTVRRVAQNQTWVVIDWRRTHLSRFYGNLRVWFAMYFIEMMNIAWKDYKCVIHSMEINRRNFVSTKHISFKYKAWPKLNCNWLTVTFLLFRTCQKITSTYIWKDKWKKIFFIFFS